MRELDDRNTQDSELKAKICKHCSNPTTVVITRTAIQDLGLIPLTKDAVLETVREHIELKRRVFTDIMDNRDAAYIIPECDVEGAVIYVKVKFVEGRNGELMVLISAHPPRRW